MDYKEDLFYFYLLIILICTLLGIFRYSIFDESSKIIFWLLVSTITSEILSRTFKVNKSDKVFYPVYHVYGVVELFLITMYFIKTVYPFYYRRLFLTLCAAVILLLECLNTMFFQPLKTINSNFIALETFLEIGMCLYALYRILLIDLPYPLTRYYHFWLWSLLLLYFSSTFFFWPCLKVLYFSHSRFFSAAAYLQITMNIIVYSGIGLVIFYYPKMIKNGS